MRSYDRKSIRLKDYDYSQSGVYFVTICAKDRMNLFGKIVGADDPVRPPVLQVNEIGEIVSECWDKINQIYDNAETDYFCIMPNHVHGIIIIPEKIGKNIGVDGQGRPSLQKIIQGFKSVTTRMCFKHQYTMIWQHGYYDHIIRNEQELQKIRQYIIDNPEKWQEDEYFI